jgi:Aminopeptidase N
LTTRTLFIIILSLGHVISFAQHSKKIKKHSSQNTPQNVALSEVKIKPVKAHLFHATPVKHLDILHTDIDVSFDWKRHLCLGKVNILLTPHFYPTDTIVLDAKNMTFQHISITASDMTELLYDVKYDKKQLRIQLEKKLYRGDTMTIKLHYTAAPDESYNVVDKAIKSDKGLYFINTDLTEPYKPMQLWTQGETESNSHWFPTIDKPNEKFTSTITITVPDTLVTLSNGKLLSSDVKGAYRTDVWVNELPMPAYLHMMAVGNFWITKDTWQNKEVSYYLEPDYHAYARKIFKHTVEMIDFFSKQLGVPYPWYKYAQVVVRDFVSGAMENTTATLHGDFVQKNPRELIDGDNDGIISHELFHQWFGDIITCESWSQLVINEGFATYGEQLWLEHKYGKDKALQKCYNSMQRYIEYANTQQDPPIVNFQYTDKEDMFSTITYQKGSRVIHLLRSIIGDEAFFKSLKNLLTKYAYDNVEIDDWRREVEAVTGVDYRQFFEQWFYRGGHPIIEIRYQYIDTAQLIAVHVEQIQSEETGLFSFPLTFKITQGRASKQFVFDIAKKKEVFYVKKINESDINRVNVDVDPDAVFVGEIIDHKPFFNHIITYNRANGYVDKVRALKELSKQQEIDSARFTLLSAINDTDEDIRYKALSWINWKRKENYVQTKEFLLNIAVNDPSATVRASAVNILGKQNDHTLKSIFINSCMDSSYSVAGEALQALYQLDSTEAYQQTIRLRNDARGKLLNVVADIIANQGVREDVNFFENNIMRYYNRQRSAILTDYVLFCHRHFTTLGMQLLEKLHDRALNDSYAHVRYTAIKQLYESKNFFEKTSAKVLSFEEKDQLKKLAEQCQNSLSIILENLTDKEVIGFLKMDGLWK